MFHILNIAVLKQNIALHKQAIRDLDDSGNADLYENNNEKYGAAGRSPHPRSSTEDGFKLKERRWTGEEERVKARLEELGIPPEGAQCPFLMKFFHPAKVTFLPCQYIPRKPRYQSVLTCHQMSSHTGT